MNLFRLSITCSFAVALMACGDDSSEVLASCVDDSGEFHASVQQLAASDFEQELKASHTAETYVWTSVVNDGINIEQADQAVTKVELAPGCNVIQVASKGEKQGFYFYLAEIDDIAGAAFLQKASFGANRNSLSELKRLGYAQWVDQQLAIPYEEEVFDAGTEGNREIGEIPLGPYQKFSRANLDLVESYYPYILNAVWLHQVLERDDQLKQRIAFALSEIMVISDVSRVQAHAGFHYLDTLLKYSNGSYRELLEAVTLNPMMGGYLDMAGNAKAGTRPNSVADENYAREVLQLFSLGLYQLNPDGSHVTDENGNSLDTYTQQDVEEYARAFTGWSYKASASYFYPGQYADRYNPMVFFSKYHDSDEIRLLNGVTVSGEDGEASLEIVLDSIASHANVAPFIGKQLIQKFVKSNPSPEYIARVSAAFNASGGNVGQTVKAVLLDSESLNPGESAGIAYKVKEPLLAYIQLLRAFEAKPKQGELVGNGTNLKWSTVFGQAPLQSPSVFNFFTPQYAPASLPEGSVAPELQIYDQIRYVRMLNLLQWTLLWNSQATADSVSNDNTLLVDFEWLVDKTQTDKQAVQASLNAALEVYVLGQAMSDELRAQIEAFQASDDITVENMAEETLALIVSAPQFWIQGG